MSHKIFHLQFMQLLQGRTNCSPTINYGPVAIKNLYPRRLPLAEWIGGDRSHGCYVFSPGLDSFGPKNFALRPEDARQAVNTHNYTLAKVISKRKPSSISSSKPVHQILTIDIQILLYVSINISYWHVTGTGP